MGIFRAYDIRGKVPEDLNPKNALDIGKAIGTYLSNQGKHKILVGRDVRTHSKEIEKSIIRGLKSTGLNLYRVGEQPFGVLFFAIEKHDLDALVFITASHLGPEWNGVKVMYSGKDLAPSKSEIQEIGRIYKDKEFKTGKGKVKKIRNARENYIKKAKKLFDLEGLRVVVDCGNGAACLVVPEMFRELGAEVKTIYGKVDGSFPNKEPKPKEGNLGKLRKEVKKGYDLGIAYDGDGDRAVFVDDEGELLNPSQIATFIADNIEEKGPIVAHVGCSMVLEEWFEEDRIIRVPVGHTYIVRNCKKHGAVVGVETSGHYVLTRASDYDDAILVSAQVADLLAEKNEKLSQVNKKYKIYPKTQLNFKCPDEKKFKVVESLKKKFKQEYENIITVDGVRVDFEGGWFLIRASNTSPKIRLYIEAEDKGKLKEIREKFRKILKKEIDKFKNNV